MSQKEMRNERLDTYYSKFNRGQILCQRSAEIEYYLDYYLTELKTCEVDDYVPNAQFFVSYLNNYWRIILGLAKPEDIVKMDNMFKFIDVKIDEIKLLILHNHDFDCWRARIELTDFLGKSYDFIYRFYQSKNLGLDIQKREYTQHKIDRTIINKI